MSHLSVQSKTRVIGLISDTHGLMRQGVVNAFTGVERIIHAGDIDSEDVLTALAGLAPVTAVRGNMDFKPGVSGLPEYERLRIGDIDIGLIHDRMRLKKDPAKEGLSVVIYGHSHRPSIERVADIYYINPGSAGPRRFRLPITIGILEITGGEISPRIIDISE